MDRNFFETGLTADQFISQLGTNREKFDQLMGECALDDQQRGVLAGMPKYNVLVIAEPWSGDVLYNLPVLLCAAAAAGWNVRVFRRDEHPELILPYRKEGPNILWQCDRFVLCGVQSLLKFLQRLAT